VRDRLLAERGGKMNVPDKLSGDEAQDEGVEGGVGDVETAGETTAAAATGNGDAGQKPVGADTMVKVADAPEGQEGVERD
jgi:hypothetical protein